MTPNDNDASPRAAWVRALEKTASIGKDPFCTFPTLIEHLAEKFGAAPALLSDGECLTYRALAERLNGYAHWALAQGFASGDVVCLFMRNCPEYMAIWLGITRIGGIVSLVNSNLTGASLAHALNVAAPRHIIVGADLVDTCVAVLPQLISGVQFWAHGQESYGFPQIGHEFAGGTVDRLCSSKYPSPPITDPALYIYTSGTTGLPKAVRVSHFRIMQWSHWFAGMMDTRPSDRMYNCLPMYHSIGGVVATGAALVGGGSVVLRQRFSAGNFWDDVVEWNCTLFQYIGELCRYLINSAPRPRETQHRIRLCCGNGLRPGVWDEFKSRFRIPQILEFYAATESNFSLYNCEGKSGSIGRVPAFLAHRFPIALIKFDIDTGEPVRDEKGFCICCTANEIGEAIGKILDDGVRLGSRFEGYTDKEASDRKVLHNVFANGDVWYRSGDLMRKDEQGYFYFVDRIGDTYRWKGENVSTTEVAEIISALPEVIEAVVYGVSIPAAEGRAGMAAVVVSPEFDLIAFRLHLADRLPGYARPLFLRVRRKIETTATFKPRKQDLANEGYNPASMTDPIYFDDRTHDAFVGLDAALYQRIQSGDLRL